MRGLKTMDFREFTFRNCLENSFGASRLRKSWVVKHQIRASFAFLLVGEPVWGPS